MIENKQDILHIIAEIRNKLDDLGVNTEVIERSNKLIYDKLDDIDTLHQSKNFTKEELAFKQYELERNSDCYITLSYVITREIGTIDNTIQDIYNKINDISSILKEGVINEQ